MNFRAFALMTAFLVSLTASHLAAQPVEDDTPWDARFNVFQKGIATGVITSLTFDEHGDLFVAGSFRVADGVTANNVARWNGQRWEALGAGVNGDVHVIIAHGSNIFVGGEFTMAGNVPAMNLARWDGTRWWPLKSVSGPVYALAFLQDQLVVAGSFSSVGFPVNNIVLWNGSTWSSDFAGGVTGVSGMDSTTPAVRVLRVEGDRLLVGGDFAMAGGISSSNLAVWDGTSWGSVGSGLPGPVHAITRDSLSNLYVGGGGSSFGPPYIARWEAGAWVYLPAGNPGNHVAISALFSYQGQLYAGDLYGDGPNPIGGLNRWNGQSWDRLAAPFYPVAIPPVEKEGELYFAGRLSEVMSPIPTESPYGKFGLAKWNGRKWFLLGAGLDTSNQSEAEDRALLAVGSDVYAGGRFRAEAGDPADHLVALWDGFAWYGLSTRISANFNSGGHVNALALGQGRVIAGGGFFGPFNNIAVWDGTEWNPLGGGLPAEVETLASRRSEIFAGGTFGVQRWDGTNWIELANLSEGAVMGSVFYHDELIVGGSFSNLSGLLIPHIARWDGTEWQPLATGVDGEVRALAVAGDRLVVGGAFTAAGEVSARRVAIWDGTNWTTLGQGFEEGLERDIHLQPAPTAVHALAVTPGDLIYAAGNFTRADGATANFAACWDGKRWRPLGSGLDQIVRALALSGDDLYLAGEFSTAGDKPSERFALWHGERARFVPRLSFAATEDDVVLRWSAAYSNYVFETTQQGDAHWVTLPYQTSSGTNFFRFPIGADRFFRLRQL